MGGKMKGAQFQTHGHIHGGGRRRWSNIYVVMVIVCCVFGCGLLGLMGLHRLRERRSLNLLIKEKDDQILSLHLLLQKEREEMVEVKKRTQEMKMKILRLGSHKAELNSRISEMESTISSLREEQRTVESAFQEKQNEANLMRDKFTQHLNDQNQLEVLKEELRQKQGEIEDLKRRLQPLGAEVGSVRLILPSNATAEANATESEAKVHENEQDRETESSTTSTEAIHTSSENGGTNADRTSDEAEPKSKEERENGKIADLGNEDRAQTQSSDNQELGVDEGWKKMEMQENSRRFRGKHGYLRRAKGKRWRSIRKQTEGKRTTSLSNGASTMADQGTLSARRNSSSESTHASIEESAKNSASKMDGVQHTQESEQLGEQISITKKTEDENEQQQHTELLGQKEVSGRNGEEQDTVQSRDSEESDDKEETDEPEI